MGVADQHVIYPGEIFFDGAEALLRSHLKITLEKSFVIRKT